MASPIAQAIKQICEEKHISYESVLETIEAALAAAYRKDFGEKNQNIKVIFDPETAVTRAFDVKTVVEDMELPEEGTEAAMATAGVPEKKGRKEAPEAPQTPTPPGTESAPGKELEEPKWNPKTMLMISEAKKIKPDAQIGDELRTELEIPGAFGRMAAQTAKQVIMQKLREAERQVVYDEYKDRAGQLLMATVQRREGSVVLFDLGRATAVMLPEDQIETEKYLPGDRMKIYVTRVALTPKGPEILVSRTHPELVRGLFTFEIPEVASGAVEIKVIAREAGSRSKVAVSATDPNIDPIGSCIGQRGTRIQTVIGELGGEKIDIVAWDADPAVFIAHALSPAKVLGVTLDEAPHTASVRVAGDQLSLAIGRGGQNVRLAAKLAGWKINVVEDKKKEEAGEEAAAEAVPEEGVAPPVAPPEGGTEA
ncbi:transcription termination/antitermination protein NusA [Candidatus Uhrbacteria bacterium]|nr:transcription termination/antitermination protein NusA [Candidatus Uhrbacteria bacterium]